MTKHIINLSDETPICQKVRRYPPPVAEEIESQCQELNSLDIIEPSISPWSSPIVPIRKKDGSLRMCIDYRQLNKVTIPDKFPVPNLLDSIFGLSGTEFFTSLDLVRGYYQMPIDDDSKEYTAFSSPKNHWQFKRLSFGLKNAPAAFQREIQAVLNSFPSNKVVAYLDDILIMGKNFEEHFELVVKVLQTLEKYNIKIKPSKCEWFRSRVEYLGHVVSRSGIRKTDDYIQKVKEFPRPKTVGELREFLGLVNFQRKFISNCSEIQKPLSCLTGGRKRKGLEWTSEMTEAFEKLKLDMQKDIELAYPIYGDDAPKIELWVDASNYGAGAYLAQKQGESHRVIGFTSMTFTSTQLRYSTLERELTALRWGVKTFRPFLYGVQFIIYTDHQPLVYLNNMKLVCSRLARTVDELSDFAFEIRYVPGKFNSAADALSRIGSPQTPVMSNCSASLPNGLMLCGEKAEGGGDSMFVSLLRTLSNVIDKKNLPSNHDDLRIILVDDLLNNSTKYNLNLDRHSRKMFKLMKCHGQLPSVDIFLAVSRLYKVKVFVYYWSKQPVIYQYEDYSAIIHLQNVSGIHYNTLVEILNYELPDVKNCKINTVSSFASNEKITPNSPNDSSDDEEYHELVKNLLEVNTSSDQPYNYCCHNKDSLPRISITIGTDVFCGILDTGAEISLVSKSVVDKLDLPLLNERLCNVIGYSGELVPITQTVNVDFYFGSFKPPKPHKFAVVDDNIFPNCFLIGLDYLTENSIDIDLSINICYQEGDIICRMNPHDVTFQNNVFNLTTGSPVEEISRFSSGDLRFKIEGNSDVITGLSLLMDNDMIGTLQSKCPLIKLVVKNIRNNIPSSNWPKRIKTFARYARKLSINNGLLTYNGPEPIIVVPFTSMVELVISVHFGMAHIGRDKIIDLLYNLIWHPSKYKTVNDICTTCHQCQILKEFSTVILPPTLKIHSNYPFEVLAADCMSLPTTSKGYIGCLVAVDHYSKWVTVIPIKNKKSSTIVEAFETHIFPHILRLPASILTDNGPEFKSSEFGQFLNEYNIVHKLTTPYCPTSNGAVERVNRTIKNLLKSLIDNGFNWDVHLPKALITYNQTLHSELNMSPSKFLLSKSHDDDYRLPLQGKIADTWRKGHPKYKPFSVGEDVLVKIEHKGFLTTNKLSAKFDGPFRITSVDPNCLTYEITNSVTGWIGKTHQSKLRNYKKPPNYLLNNTLYVEMCGSNVIVSDVKSMCESTNFYVSNETDSSSDGESSMRNSVTSSDEDTFSGFSDASARSLMSPHDTLSSKSSFSASPNILHCRGCYFEKELENSLKINFNENEAALNALGRGERDRLNDSCAAASERSEASSKTIQSDMYRLTFPDGNDEVLDPNLISRNLVVEDNDNNGIILENNNNVEIYSTKRSSVRECSPGDVDFVCVETSLDDSSQCKEVLNNHDVIERYSSDRFRVWNMSFDCALDVPVEENNMLQDAHKVDVLSLSSTAATDTDDSQLDQALNWQVSSIEDSDCENFDNPFNPDVLRHAVERHLVSSFEGFSNPSSHDDNITRLKRLQSVPPSEVVGNDYSSDNNEKKRHTRSMGPVIEYSNVQLKLLERKSNM